MKTNIIPLTVVVVGVPLVMLTEADMDDAERRAERPLARSPSDAEVAAQNARYPALPGGTFTQGGREAEAAVEEADMEAMVGPSLCLRASYLLILRRFCARVVWESGLS